MSASLGRKQVLSLLDYGIKGRHDQHYITLCTILAIQTKVLQSRSQMDHPVTSSSLGLEAQANSGRYKNHGVLSDYYFFCNSPTLFSSTCSLVHFLFSAKEHFAFVSTSAKPLCIPSGQHCHQQHFHNSGPSIPLCFDQVTLYKWPPQAPGRWLPFQVVSFHSLTGPGWPPAKHSSECLLEAFFFQMLFIKCHQVCQTRLTLCKSIRSTS